MPNARTRSAVDWPTHAIFTPEKARASKPNSLNFSHTARTALVEVNTTHWNRPSTRPLTARSIWAGLRGGSTAMVGTSIGNAPWDTSFSLISPAWSFVRGTSTVQPYRARLSHQFSLARLATVLPMVTTSGPARGAGSVPASVAVSSRPASVVSTERCWHVVPFAVTTAGVVSASPYSISVRAASGRCDAVACRISGPGAAASADQSTSPRTSATVCAEPSGSPAYVGTAVVSGRPGTISKFRWVFASAFTSVITASTDSGSPATSRTTSTPVRASVASVLATSAGSPSAGRMSGPPGTAGPSATGASGSASSCSGACAGSGPDGGGSSQPARASTASGTSGSVKTSAAL